MRVLGLRLLPPIGSRRGFFLVKHPEQYCVVGLVPLLPLWESCTL